MTRFSLALVALLASSLLQAQELPKVAVFGIQIQGIALAGNVVVDVLVAAIAQTGRYDVISKNEIETLLGLEKMKDALGCDELSCMAELGGALGVERMVGGSLSRLGDTIILSLQRIHTVEAKVEQRVTMQWQGPEADIVSLLGAAVQKLFLPAAELVPASVEVTMLPDGAEVFLDNRKAQASGQTLDVGPHALKVRAQGFKDKTVHFIVKAGETIALDGTLEAVALAAPAVAVVAPKAPTNLGFGMGLELNILTDGSSKLDRDTEKVVPMFHLSVTYQLWARLGLDFRFATVISNGQLSSTEPWPSTTVYGEGPTMSLSAVFWPVLSPDRYGLWTAAGGDLHIRNLSIVSPTLPRSASLLSDEVDGQGRGGFHVGSGFDVHLGRRFAIGIAARYYWTPPDVVRARGQSLERSLSALALGGRMALRF